MTPRHTRRLIALAVALPGLAGAQASAPAGADAPPPSSVSIYGTIDLGLDRVSKAQGDVSGTVYSLVNGAPVSNAVASPRATSTRLAPSLSAQSLIGFKGQEQIGGGYVAKFALEGGFAGDNGSHHAGWPHVGPPGLGGSADAGR